MDPESKKLLEETFRLAEENNKMLLSVRRSMRISQAMRFVYWALIIGVSIGAFYFIQPYIDQLLDVYSGAKSNLDSVNSLLNNFKN